MCLISAKCIQQVNLTPCVLVLSDSQLSRHCSEDSLCATFIFLLWLHTALFASCWAAGGAASPRSSIPLESLITGTHYLSPLDPEGHKHTVTTKKKKKGKELCFQERIQMFCFFQVCLHSQQQSLIPPLPCLTQKYNVRRLVANCRKKHNTEDVGIVWPTADIHPAAPGVSLPRCLSPHTALCRSPQTFAAPAVTLPCRTPVRRKNRKRQKHRKVC